MPCLRVYIGSLLLFLSGLLITSRPGAREPALADGRSTVVGSRPMMQPGSTESSIRDSVERPVAAILINF